MKKIQLTALLLLFSLILPLTIFAAGEDSSIPAINTDAEPLNATEDTPVFPPETSPNPPVTSPETTPDTSPDTSEPPVSNKVSLLPQNELRAGEKVTFYLHAWGDNLLAMQGEILYDSALFTLEECKSALDGWNFTFSAGEGKIDYLGLNTMGQGLSGENDLIILTFRVAKEIPTDSSVTMTLTPPEVYNGEEEVIYEGDSPSFSIAPPFSTDCALKELQVENGTIFPAFDPSITEYSMTLPFSVEIANITAIANDTEFAAVEIGNTTLAVGTNYVEITVISQAGTRRVYTIEIKRSTDPNYKPSADNRILALTVTEGLLFPTFSPDVTSYSIYLVRGQEASFYPIPANKAVAGNLHIPDDTEETEYRIVCSAENGTTREYVFKVILLETPKQLEKQSEKLRKEQETSSIRDLLYNVTFIAISATLFFLGFVFGALLLGKRKKSHRATRQEASGLGALLMTPPEELSLDPHETSSTEPAPVAPPTEAPTEAPLEESPAEVSAEEPAPEEPMKEDAEESDPVSEENSPAQESDEEKSSEQPMHTNHPPKKHKKKRKH